MKLFTKIFIFMFISLIVVVFFISYFISIEQISNAKQKVLQENKIIGSFLSKEVEVGYFESHWPFESLKKLSEYKGFLFWWIVDDKGVIHLANNASFIRTVAKDYFPEIELKRKQAISLNLDKNFGIFFKPLGTGKNKWSFWYGFSLDKISERKKDIILLITSISISALLVVGITLFFGIKYFMRPIKTLSDGASIIGSGNLAYRVEMESQDEFSDLAQSFNKMADDLQKSYTSLQESETRFRELSELLPQPVFEMDVSGNFIYSNPCGFETFGYTKEDLEKGVNALQLFIPEERERIQQNIQKRFAGEDFERHEYTGLRKDGSTFPILIYSATIMREGQRVGVRGIVLDISERKRVEEKLRRSEIFLNAIVENIPDMIFVKEAKELRFVRFNKAGENLLGYNREELISKKDYDVFPEAEADFFTEKDREVLEKGKLIDIAEEPIHTKYKGKRILHTKKIPLIDEKGQPEYLLGISEDITERKLNEEKIIRAKEEWEQTFNTVPELIAIIDDKHRMVRINKAMSDKLGVSPDDAVGLTCYEYVHGAKEPPPFCPHSKLLSDGKEHLEEVYEYGWGGIFQVSVTPFRDSEGKLVGSVHVARDITEHKQSEKALRKSEELLRATIESTADGILVVDEKGLVTHTNRRFAQMWRIPDELIKTRQDKKLLDFVLGQLKEPEAFLLKVQVLYQKSDEDFDVLYFKDGRIFERYSCPLIRDRQITGRVWSFRDITDRKQTEQALRESEIKYRRIFNDSIAAIYVFDNEKNFLDSNQAGLDLLGYSRQELLNMSIPDVDVDPKVVLSAHEQLLGGERIVNYEHQLKRKDGRIITVLNNSRPLTDTQGNIVGMQSTLIDITVRKYAEEQLKASLKEKEILLREIHHRVKNNLAVISSLLSMQSNIVDNQNVYSALHESQSRIRAMALIHETLYQSESLSSIDLERYAKDLVGNIVTAFDGIAGRVNFETEVRDVKLEINQAIPCGLIINELITNALKHAFPDEQYGVVRITAAYTKESEVGLTVSDNGIGFSDELGWKKSKSLGLRLISLMVDQLHGNMNIRNNHGAEIVIKWPLQIT